MSTKNKQKKIKEVKEEMKEENEEIKEMKEMKEEKEQKFNIIYPKNCNLKILLNYLENYFNSEEEEKGKEEGKEGENEGEKEEEDIVSYRLKQSLKFKNFFDINCYMVSFPFYQIFQCVKYAYQLKLGNTDEAKLIHSKITPEYLYNNSYLLSLSIEELTSKLSTLELLASLS